MLLFIFEYMILLKVVESFEKGIKMSSMRRLDRKLPFKRPPIKLNIEDGRINKLFHLVCNIFFFFQGLRSNGEKLNFTAPELDRQGAFSHAF